MSQQYYTSNISATNATLTYCSSSHMSGLGTFLVTLMSLFLYGFAFFVMSTAVGQDPRISSFAGWKRNCSQYCTFMSNLVSGLFFCCGNKNASATSEFDLTGIRQQSSARRSAMRSSQNNNSNNNSRSGFQVLRSVNSNTTTDAYADNNNPHEVE